MNGCGVEVGGGMGVAYADQKLLSSLQLSLEV